jgi:hypothetical protein
MLTNGRSTGLDATKPDNFRVRFWPPQFGKNIGVDQASPSQFHMAHGKPLTPGFDVAAGRFLQGGDQRRAGTIALEPAKFSRRHDDDLIAPMHGDVLRSVAGGAPHLFAETRPGVLQGPAARRSLILGSSYTDWNIMSAGVFQVPGLAGLVPPAPERREGFITSFRPMSDPLDRPAHRFPRPGVSEQRKGEFYRP